MKDSRELNRVVHIMVRSSASITTPVYIFRPAYIYPVEPQKEPNFSYRFKRAIYPAFRMLFPNQVIRADELAEAMVDVVVRGAGEYRSLLLENRDTRAMVFRFNLCDADSAGSSCRRVLIPRSDRTLQEHAYRLSLTKAHVAAVELAGSLLYIKLTLCTSKKSSWE